MTIKINDPRLTQYALGEMKEEDIKAFENEIKDNQEILEEIEEIRKFSDELENGFGSDPELSLTDTRQEKIRNSAAKVKNIPFNKTLFIKVILTSAAMVVFTTVVFHEDIGRALGISSKPIEIEENDLNINITQRPPVQFIPPIPEIPEPPESAKTIESINIVRPDIGLEGVSVKTTTEIEMPNLLNMKPRSSALKMVLTGNSNRIAGRYFSTGSNRDVNLGPRFNTETYTPIEENHFRQPFTDPLSTLSIDVDTASYANVRRFLNHGSLPPADAVRIEEMVNYFKYEYSQPKTGKPFSVNFEMAACPWQPNNRLVKIGIKGKEIAKGKRPASNLVFLLDVSGSMGNHNKLPLLKKSMKLLVENLDKNDRVAIVVYAGSSGLVLPSTTADKKDKIMSALERLKAGGSTNGGAGIQLAYNTAVANFIEGGTNRVILATDGDFNVGVTNEGDLEKLIRKKAKSGIFLSVLGFGMGNYKDNNLEKLSAKGNGNYAYIDTLNEAKKVLVNEMGSTLVTIAKDVKIQVEFNPAQVEAYRLIGYENRKLNKKDFNDDQKDAGEIGAGHSVTAFYEIVPKGIEMHIANVDPLKYQKPKIPMMIASGFNDEVMTVKLRYKQPDEKTSKLLEFPLKNEFKSYASASDDFKFASSVAAFGMLLRNSQYRGNATFEGVLELAEEGLKNDEFGYKKEFISLIKKAQKLHSINKE